LWGVKLSNQFIIPLDDHSDVLVFPIGTFYRDGKQRELTKEQAALIVQNYLDNVLDRKDNLLPVNAEHVREQGRIAYLKSLYQDDAGNVRGVIDGDLSKFDYISPEVVWDWDNPNTGESHGPVVMGAGATNYPFFLGQMGIHSQLWLGNEWWTNNQAESNRRAGEDPNNPPADIPQIASTPSALLLEESQMSDELIDSGGEQVSTTDTTGQGLAIQPITLDALPPAEDYSEKYSELAEQFAELKAALEASQSKNTELAEAFAESEKARRLMHFSDVAGNLAIAVEPEQFAEDLYAIEQADPELAERVIARFRAASESNKAAGLFQQFSSAEETESGDPWLNKVEAVRKEHFADKGAAEGWVLAEKRAQQENPQMARDYAERSRE
jgi:hypothetical protein